MSEINVVPGAQYVIIVRRPGVQGLKGDTGPKGDKGDTGDDGESVEVFLIDEADWPPPPDGNPLHWYVKVPDGA